MKRIILLIVVAALGWSAFWFVSARQMRTGIEGWFEDRRADGWQAEYGDLRIAGFPNRLDVTFEQLSLADPEAGVSWEIGFFQVLQQVYDPGLQILVFGNDQQISTPEGGVDVTSQGLKASVRRADDMLTRLNLEADTLALSGDGGALALAGLRAGFEQDLDPNAYSLSLAADTVAGDSGAPASDAVQLRTHVGFDAPWPADTLTRARPQPRSLAIHQAQYRDGDLMLRLGGELEFDDTGLPMGALTLRAENWRSLLDRAVKAGQLNASVAEGLGQALGLIAGLGGRGDQLDLPLSFSGGKVRLGPLPLGDAPRLRIP